MAARMAIYLSGCARQPFNVRCAHYAREASLSTFGFVTIVPRYLLPQVIPSHSFAALTALVGRRVNGHGNQPCCLYWLPARPPQGALACAPGSGTLPPHLAAAPCRPLNILSIMRRQVWRWNSESPIWYPPGYPAIRVPCRQCGAAAATSPA